MRRETPSRSTRPPTPPPRCRVAELLGDYLEVEGLVSVALFGLGDFDHSGSEKSYLRGMCLGSSDDGLSVRGLASSRGFIS